MKKKLLSIIFAGVALVSASTLFAYADSCRWYVSGTGSVCFFNDLSVNEQAGAGAGLKKDSYKLGQKNGFGGSIAVGRIINNWRLELEASHRHTSTNKDKKNNTITINGKEKKALDYKGNTSFMGNVYYDIPVCGDLSVYLGAGAGLSLVHANVNTFEMDKNGQPILAQVVRTSGVRDTVFAYQFMTGVSYALDAHWDLTAGYRYFATAKPTFINGHGQKLKARKAPHSNNIEVGLRYKF